jgi:hypothetical protein
MENLMEQLVKLAADELGNARVIELVESMTKVTKIDGYVKSPGVVDTMLGPVLVDSKIALTNSHETMHLEVVKSCGKYSYVAVSASTSDFNLVSSKRRVGRAR